MISIPFCGNTPVSSWYSRFGSSYTRLIHLKKERTLYGLKFCGHAFMICIKSIFVTYSVAIQRAGRKPIPTWGLYKTTLFYQQHCKYCSLYINTPMLCLFKKQDSQTRIWMSWEEFSQIQISSSSVSHLESQYFMYV